MKRFLLSVGCIAICFASAARNGNGMMRGFQSPQELRKAIKSHLSYTNDPEKLKTKNFNYVYELIKMNKSLYGDLGYNDKLTIEYDLSRLDTDLYRWLLQYPNAAERQVFKKQLAITNAIFAMLKAEGLLAIHPSEMVMMPGSDDSDMMYTGSPKRMPMMGSDMEM